jgi:hypothetical protein
MRRDPLRLTPFAWSGALLIGLLVALPAGFAQEGSGEKPEKPKTVKKKAPPATAPAGKPAGKEGEEPKGTPEIKESPEAAATPATTATKTAKKPSIDEEYVRANLEKHLNPQKIEWLPDGRVKLTFDFSEKKEEHVDIFTPRVSKDYQSTFRWSLPGEYTYWRGTTTTSDLATYNGALRLSQKGTAHLNAWFTDDIEAEIWFANGASTTNQQIIALVYSSGTKSIGSNWGTMAASFQGGILKGGKGAVENAPSDTNVKIKLVIRNGTFEVYRDGKMRQSEKYNAKSYASGKLGFIWGGNLAGFIYKLDIIARPDAKKMAELLRKSTRK